MISVQDDCHECVQDKKIVNILSETHCSCRALLADVAEAYGIAGQDQSVHSVQHIRSFVFSPCQVRLLSFDRLAGGHLELVYSYTCVLTHIIPRYDGLGSVGVAPRQYRQYSLRSSELLTSVLLVASAGLAVYDLVGLSYDRTDTSIVRVRLSGGCARFGGCIFLSAAGSSPKYCLAILNRQTCSAAEPLRKQSVPLKQIFGKSTHSQATISLTL